MEQKYSKLSIIAFVVALIGITSTLAFLLVLLLEFIGLGSIFLIKPLLIYWTSTMYIMPIFSLLAIIFSIGSLIEIKKYNLKGKTLSIIALVISILHLVTFFIPAMIFSSGFMNFLILI